MKTTLNDLNNYLFEQLERLNDDEILENDTNFEKEIKRSKAIAVIAKNIVDNANTELEAVKLASEYGRQDVKVPKLLLGDSDEKMD